MFDPKHLQVAFFSLSHLDRIGGLLVIVADQMQRPVNNIQKKFILPRCTQFPGHAIRRLRTDDQLSVQPAIFLIVVENKADDVGFVIVSKVLLVQRTNRRVINQGNADLRAIDSMVRQYSLDGSYQGIRIERKSLLVGDFDFVNLIRQGFSMKGCDTGSNFASNFSN